MTHSVPPSFAAYLAKYARAVSNLSYRDVTLLQTPPHANVGHGAAGTAAALLRLSESQHVANARPLVRRLLDGALADRRRAAIWHLDDRPPPSVSFLFGRAGIHAIAALAHAGRDSAARRRALLGFVRASRRTGADELMHGTAGCLVAAIALLQHIRDDRLQRLGDDLAGHLLERARRRMRRPWQPADATGFAHGWPGILYAVLAWQAFRREPPDARFVEGLGRLARTWRPDACATPGLRGSWCNGAAGVALLWCKAFECTREPAFLRAAQDTARAAIDHMPEQPYLCCGMAGVAYALLALERVEPEHGWRERALELGARALETPLVTRWPNGLLMGHPGLVCLTLDLLSEEPRGFPWIDS